MRRRLLPALRALVDDETGASMAEYALLVAGVALVAVVGVRALGSKITYWGNIVIPWLFQ